MTELGGSIDKMHRDKVALESQMEMEEEGIVNRLNRLLPTKHMLLIWLWTQYVLGILGNAW